MKERWCNKYLCCYAASQYLQPPYLCTTSAKNPVSLTAVLFGHRAEIVHPESVSVVLVMPRGCPNCAEREGCCHRATGGG